MPYFEVKDQDGNTVNSMELLGRKTIIYFYPKDNTSGCTAEACNLRDNYGRMVALGYNVIGVSKDSSKSHKNFAEKHSLPFTLLADTSPERIQAFGAWGEKSLYGKKYMGTLRMTFIFDENGILTEVGNASEICKAMKKIAGDKEFADNLSLNAAKIKYDLSLENTAKKWMELL